MRLRAVLSVIVLAVGTAFAGEPPAASSSGTAQADPYWPLKAERIRAYRDRDRGFFETMLAPDFVALGTDGRHLSRAEYLDAELGDDSRAAPPVETEVTRFRSVRRGKTLVLTYDEVERSQVGSQPFVVQLARLDVYVLVHGAWRLQAMTAVRRPEVPAVLELEPAALDAYVGTYRFGPQIVSVVRRDGARLLERSTGSAEGELLPVGRDLFYSPSDPGSRTEFVRDDRGRVTAQLYRSATETLRAERVSSP